MNAAANLEWLYLAGGWILGGCATALLIWALFLDRKRKQRRCAKCWYDMSATAGLLCPECGREARSEKGLHRTRRRWRFAALAAMLGLIAYGVGSVPRYQSGGWVALVPSVVLVLLAPAEDDSTSGQWMFTGSISSVTPSPFASGAATTRVLTTGETLTDEVWRRLRSHRLAAWQSQEFIGRYLTKQKIDLFQRVTLPRRWPVGEAVPMLLQNAGVSGMEMWARGWDGSWAPTPGARIAGSSTPGQELRVELGLGSGMGPIYRTSRNMTIELVGTREDLLEQLNTEGDNALVKQALRPHIAMNSGAPVLIIYDRGEDADWKAIDFGVAFAFDVTLDGKVLFSGRGGANWVRAVWKNWEEVPIPANAAAAVLSGRAVITIRGNAGPVTDEYVSWPFDKPSAACWAGEFSAALRVGEHPGVETKK